MARRFVVAGLVGLSLAMLGGHLGAKAASAATVSPLAGEWQGQLRVGTFILSDSLVLNANGTYSDLQYAYDYWAFVEGIWSTKGNVLAFLAEGCAWNGNVDHCVPGAAGSPTAKTYGAVYRQLNANLMAVYPLALKTWLIYQR